MKANCNGIVVMIIWWSVVNSAYCQLSGDIRLVGGNNHFEGRVEIYYGYQWGTVCDDGFGTSDAIVVCRQLGFTGGRGYCCARLGQGSGNIWLDGLSCTGNEKRLIDCNSRPIGSFYSCSHSEDVGVQCLRACEDGSVRLSDGLIPEQGTAEVCIDGRWSGVCDYNWDYKDAFVFCRQLGYPATDAKVFTSSFFGTYHYPSNKIFYCLGTESTLQECHNSSYTCYSYRLAGVHCKGEMVSDSNCIHGNIRLAGGQESNEGRIEVCTDGLWSTVYGGNWDINDAIVACRQLGYVYPNRISLYSIYQSQINFGSGKGPIALSNLHCDGSESSLFDCDSSVYYNSYHHHDIGVKCQHIPPSYIGSCTNGSVRLVGGNSSFEGRVEICVNGIWGSVCDYSWSINDAAVVCQQLGFIRQNASAVRGSFFGEGEGPYHYSAMYCNLHENSLLECSSDSTITLGRNCIPGHESGVRCDPSDHCTHGDVRLYGGYTNQDGIAEVCIDGHWGNICDDGSGLTRATVFCRQLSGRTSIAVDYSYCCSYLRVRYFGNVSLTNLQCNQNEDRIVDGCTYGLVAGSSSDGCSLREESSFGCYEFSDCITGEVRLLDGSNELEGRVEVCINGIWRAVTENWWDQVDAVAVCKQLDFPYQWAQAVRRSAFGRGNAPFGIQSISCSGSETYLLDCSFNLIGVRSLNNPRAFTYSLSNYRTYYTAGVVCQGPVMVSPECEEGSVQLVNGQIETEGRVEICYNGTWIVVCDRYWRLQETLTVCRQLGYPTYNAVYLGESSFGLSTTAPLFHRYSCPSQASNISECSMNIFYNNFCHRGTTVGVRCQDVSYYNVTITSSPEDSYQLGSNVQLSCHIEPEPENVTLTYRWRSSNLFSYTTSIPDTTVTIRLYHPSEALYHCTVYNSINNVRLGYGSIILRVRGVIHPAMHTGIQASTQETIILQVNTTDSSIDYLRELAWYHNGKRVEQTELSQGNTTLTISNATKENDGVYETRFEGLFVYPHDRLCEKLAVGLLRHYPLLKPVYLYVNSNESSTARVIHGVTINNATDAVVSFMKHDNVTLYVEGHLTSIYQYDESLIFFWWYFNGQRHYPQELETIHHNNMISQVSDYQDMDLADSGTYEVLLVLNTYVYFTRHYPHCQSYYNKFFLQSNHFGTRYVILSRASAKLQYYEMLSFEFKADDTIISPSGSTTLTCTASIKFPPLTSISIIKDNKTLASSTSKSVQVNTKDIGVSPFGVYTCVVDASGTLLKKETSIEEGDRESNSLLMGGLFTGWIVVGILIAVLIIVVIVIVVMVKRRRKAGRPEITQPTISPTATDEVKSADERYTKGAGIKKPNIPLKVPTKPRSAVGGRPAATTVNVSYTSTPSATSAMFYEPVSPHGIEDEVIYEDTDYM